MFEKDRHSAMVGTRFRKTELTNSNRTFWDFSEPSAFCHEISDKSNNVSKTAIQLFPGKRKLYIDTIVEEVKRKKIEHSEKIVIFGNTEQFCKF